EGTSANRKATARIAARAAPKKTRLCQKPLGPAAAAGAAATITAASGWPSGPRTGAAASAGGDVPGSAGGRDVPPGLPVSTGPGTGRPEAGRRPGAPGTGGPSAAASSGGHSARSGGAKPGPLGSELARTEPSGRRTTA